MREARFDEAVDLVPVAEIVADYPRLRPNLGRRLAMGEPSGTPGWRSNAK
jgi:hypothetical protein